MLSNLENALTIRTEAFADLIAIGKLLKKAPQKEQAKLVSKLRENANITLSIVACTDEGEIIAHLLFSPLDLDNQNMGMQIISSFFVKHEFQHIGVEDRLLIEGLDMLNELGYSGCISFETNDIYKKLGFYQTRQLYFNLDNTPQNIFVRELIPNSIDRCEMKVTLSEEMREYFNRIFDEGDQ